MWKEEGDEAGACSSNSRRLDRCEDGSSDEWDGSEDCRHRLVDLDTWLSHIIGTRRAETMATGAAAAGGPSGGAGSVQRPLDISEYRSGSTTGVGSEGSASAAGSSGGWGMGGPGGGAAGFAGGRGLVTIQDRLMELRLALEGALL